MTTIHRTRQWNSVSMPPEWWHELGPIGTFDDAVEHLDALEDVGVDSVGLFPAPELEIAWTQVDDVLRLPKPLIPVD